MLRILTNIVDNTVEIPPLVCTLWKLNEGDLVGVKLQSFGLHFTVNPNKQSQLCIPIQNGALELPEIFINSKILKDKREVMFTIGE